MPLSGKTKGYIALFVISIVWGTTWVVSKIIIKEVPPLQMVYMRQFMAGISLVLYFLIVKKFKMPTAVQFGWLLVMSFLMIVFANGFSTMGVKYIPAGLAALIGALYPIIVVLIEKVFLKKKNMTAFTFLGLFLGLMGVAVVFYENAFIANKPGFLLGVGLSIIAVLSWSLGTVFLARNKANINPYYGTGWQMLLASVFLYLMSLMSGKNIPWSTVTLQSWSLIFYLIIIGSILAFIAFITAMKYLPAAIASLYSYLNPFVAMFIAAIVLNEKLTINILWGSALTLVGVFLVNYSIKKNQQKIISVPEL